MSKFKFFIYVLLLVPLLSACNDTNEEMEAFTAEGIHPGSSTNYDLSIEMDEKEMFYVEATIEIENNSADDWETLDFYFIPNMFTEENSPDLPAYASIEITSIEINQEDIDYSLTKDTLSIPLKENVEPNQTVIADISYSFTLPEEGLRFTKNEDNYYLAQWYPMVPTYKNGSGWNKKDYNFIGETYHTTFSDFQITYNFPSNLTIVSSSPNDAFPSANKGTLTVENEKEVFIALLNNPLMSEATFGETNIRVFGWEENRNEEILSTALSAIEYFSDFIGPYPDEQLDIIMHEIGMEYPGIVTAGSYYGMDNLILDAQKEIVIHEIAHQWFYRVVSNDPFHDSWLDEGLTELAAFLFQVESGNLDFTFSPEEYDDYSLPVNLSLDDYQANDISAYAYRKPVAMLGKLFEENGGKEAAENFLKSYYEHYQYKEVNTEEFVRFMKYHLDIEDDGLFEEWIELND